MLYIFLLTAAWGGSPLRPGWEGSQAQGLEPWKQAGSLTGPFTQNTWRSSSERGKWSVKNPWMQQKGITTWVWSQWGSIPASRGSTKDNLPGKPPRRDLGCGNAPTLQSFQFFVFGEEA